MYASHSRRQSWKGKLKAIEAAARTMCIFLYSNWKGIATGKFASKLSEKIRPEPPFFAAGDPRVVPDDASTGIGPIIPHSWLQFGSWQRPFELAVWALDPAFSEQNRG